LHKAQYMNLNIKNETSTLKAVVLGQPGSIGKIPEPEKVYDAKSYESVLNGVYPTEVGDLQRNVGIRKSTSEI